MKNSIIERLDGSERNTEESFKDFFILGEGVEEILNHGDINYFKLFANAGESLDNLPLLNISTKARKRIAESVPLKDCHNFARELLHCYVTDHKEVDAKLYYGYVDTYTDGRYTGMYSHSFLTLLINGERTLFDPLLIKYIGYEERTLICSHYGINLPYDYIVSMFPMNYSRHIRTEIIPSKEKTEELINKILSRK